VKYKWAIKCFNYIAVFVVLGFGVYNANYFDIGRTLDKDLSATQLFREEFEKLPDNAIFMPNYAWEWEAIYKFNKDNGKNIYPICIDILPSKLYQQQLIKDGIKLVASENSNHSILASETAKSIVELNDNVWTTVVYDPYTFGSNVVATNRDSSFVANVDRAKIQQISENPQVQWKPYHPYHIIDTSLFITSWNYILFSNWNVRFFASWASIGLLLMWLFNWFTNRRTKVELEENKNG